jgi:hypothetical protein
MRVGLYSAIAWRNLTDPAYPGSGCNDVALRAFRQVLPTRQGEQGHDARKFVDFWDTDCFVTSS